MDPVEILVDTDENKDESAGTTETAAGGTEKSGGSPTSQRSRTLSVEERTRDLVRDGKSFLDADSNITSGRALLPLITPGRVAQSIVHLQES